MDMLVVIPPGGGPVPAWTPSISYVWMDGSTFFIVSVEQRRKVRLKLLTTRLPVVKVERRQVWCNFDGNHFNDDKCTTADAGAI